MRVIIALHVVWDNQLKALVGLSFFPDQTFLNLCLPLFEHENVEVLEWSFDHCHYAKRPEWFHLLLKDYSEAGRLLAHGVHYSAFTGKMTDDHHLWLDLWKMEQLQLQYVHISEHIGYKSQHKHNSGFPLPLDYHLVNVQDFEQQITALQISSEIPLGFEILALSLSYQQVVEQAKFVTQLCQRFNTFIVLDLHNLYCQALNFDLEMDELIAMYPIEYIREIHVSGGSFSESDFTMKKIRRDTHDGVIPEELFKVLQDWLPRLQYCQYIIFEQLPESLKTEHAQQQFIADYHRLLQVRNDYAVETSDIFEIAPKVKPPKQIQPNLAIAEEQEILANALMQSQQPQDIQKLKLNYFENQHWSLAMIETAMRLSQRWNIVEESQG